MMGTVRSWTMRAALIGVTVAACSGPPPQRPDVDLGPLTRCGTAAFPGAPSVLAGFARADGDAKVRIGDAVLFGVEFWRAGQVDRRLLKLEVVGTPRTWADESGAERSGRRRKLVRITTTTNGEVTANDHSLGIVDVELRQLDPNGAEIAQSTTWLFEEPLRSGFRMVDHDLHVALLMSMQQLGASDPIIRDLLFTVVDAPGMFSVLAHFGAKVTLLPGVGYPLAVDGFSTLGPTALQPIDLAVNGNMALWSDLVVAEPSGALITCGGLLGAVARHPTDADRFAVVRLLATRRGRPDS